MAKPPSLPPQALDAVPENILAHLESLPPATPPEGDAPPVILPDQATPPELELPPTSAAIPEHVQLPEAHHVPDWVLA